MVEQTFSASDETALRSDLEQKGFYIFTVRRPLNLKGLGVKNQKIPTASLMLFAQELAALLKAGLPLVHSLEVMLERQKHPLFKRSLTSIRDKVKSGVSLSEAVRAEGAIYPPMLSASLVAGERTGSLEDVLRRFVQYMRLNLTLKRKAISAAVYPSMLFCMMLVLVVVLVVKVIPEFEKFYADFDVKLPWLTRTMMSVSLAVRGNLVWIVLGLGGLIAAFVAWRRRPGSGVALDRMFLRLPYLGRLMRIYATSQLSRTLSSLLAGGLPLVNAMEVAGSSIGNRAMAAAVGQAVPHIREGKSLTYSLETTRMLENVALEMIKVGEQTGALGDMLNAIAEFYDEELDTSVATVLSLVEPIMLVLMAVVVATMLLSFYLPLFEAVSALQK
ncbi:MAG TPA: type II secretion system F family protein [Vicinamibacteria bacterium]